MQRVFSFEIRLECIRLYEEENLSPGAIAKKIGTVHSVVERWLKLYKYNGIEGLKIKDYNQQYDDDLKSKADTLFKELGTDTTSAIRMFLTQAIAYEGIPFEIKKLNKPTSLNAMTEEQILERLALSRTEAANGNYKDADSVLESIRAKYEL